MTEHDHINQLGSNFLEPFKGRSVRPLKINLSKQESILNEIKVQGQEDLGEQVR